MAAETQYTANTGMVQIATANTNLDGTGTVGTLLTAAANGTLVKSIVIKATGNTTQGMIRLFCTGGGSTNLVAEIAVPAITKSAQDPTFECYVPLNYALLAGDVLKVATQIGETFNVFAEGLDWAYYGGAVRPESTNYYANTGMVQIATANGNYDGSGTLGTVLTAGSSATYKGCNIQSIKVKAIVNTTAGMIRLFLYNGTDTRLFKEIPVSAITKSGTAQSFSVLGFLGGNDFALQASWLIKASTQVGETFNVIAEGLDWKYPA